jgi:hypothetical protein
LAEPKRANNFKNLELNIKNGIEFDWFWNTFIPNENNYQLIYNVGGPLWARL